MQSGVIWIISLFVLSAMLVLGKKSRNRLINNKWVGKSRKSFPPLESPQYSMYKHRVLDMLNPLEGKNWILQWLIVALPKISTLFVDGVEITVRVGVNNNYIRMALFVFRKSTFFYYSHCHGNLWSYSQLQWGIKLEASSIMIDQKFGNLLLMAWNLCLFFFLSDYWFDLINLPLLKDSWFHLVSTRLNSHKSTLIKCSSVVIFGQHKCKLVGIRWTGKIHVKYLTKQLSAWTTRCPKVP